ncbi:hypothetical protein STEG23_020248, partial [Scotinomys teguina]
MTGSMALLQPGSVLMSEAPDTFKDHTDTKAFPRSEERNLLENFNLDIFCLIFGCGSLHLIPLDARGSLSDEAEDPHLPPLPLIHSSYLLFIKGKASHGYQPNVEYQ